jgi:hypothetical protein
LERRRIALPLLAVNSLVLFGATTVEALIGVRAPTLVP